MLITKALQGGLYQWALTQQNQRFEDRERLNIVALNQTDLEVLKESLISLKTK